MIASEEAPTKHRIGSDDFPVSIGGPDQTVSLPDESTVLAHLGRTESGVFIQAEPDVSITCNGSALNGSQWLNEGDLLQIGANRLRIRRDDHDLVLELSQNEAAAPSLTPPPQAPASPQGAFTPKPLKAKSKSSAFPIARVAIGICLVMLAMVAAYVFLAVSFTLNVNPAPDQVKLHGLTPQLGGRYLLLPGTYRLTASKEGYYPVDVDLEAGRDQTSAQLTMTKMPGFLSVETTEGAEIYVDGKIAGTAPRHPLELENGVYAITIKLDRHRDFEAEVTIEGMGVEQSLAANLEPLWAPVSFSSEPTGAAVIVDGQRIGATPLKADILEGAHRVEISRAGFKSFRARFTVAAGQPLTIPHAKLQPSDGNLILDSKPAGAAVSIDGVYKGDAPLEVALPPGREFSLKVAKAGFASKEQKLSVTPGNRKILNIELDPLMGDIQINAWPPDAELVVNDEVHGPADGKIQLQAIEQKLVIRKPGYETWRQTVTPLPGVAKSLDVELRTLERVKKESIKTVFKDSQDHQLQLIQPGKLSMGASRREAGRRANETMRVVELTKPYYIAAHEVTNQQFARFRPKHDSGQVGGESLAMDKQPVVQVTWEDAAAYCNWLSQKEGLTPFYIKSGDTYIPAEPKTNGYRLPTEAEWAWAARYPKGGSKALKYPWGDKMPVAAKSGNFADASAKDMISGALTTYNDGFRASANVGSFPANPAGVFDLGGNVAEWIHDVYHPRHTDSKDPFGPDEGAYRVIRGSSYMHSTITELRFSFRDYGKKPRRDVGFRVARYLE